MRANTLRAFLIFLAICVVIAAAAWLLKPELLNRQGYNSDASIALVYVEGMITGSQSTGSMFTGETGASSIDICSQLYQIRDDESVKALVLRVNSPGGAAAASDEIFRAVCAVKEKKPVVVSMGDVAASGGYYLSSAADYIFANGATLTGSIGVVFNLINWQEAARKLGIQDQTLTAGEYKDIGSPWRPMTDSERKQLTDLMTEVHTQFIQAVDEGRENLDEAQVRALATGMVYTGERALEVGLIDEIGGLEQAEIKARELANVAADMPVSEYGVSSLWDELMSISSRQAGGVQLLRGLAEDPLLRLAQGLYLNTTLRDLVIR